MTTFRLALLRMMLLAGAILAVPAASFAQFAVGITVGFPPPPLPLYAQPPCPQPNYMWTPGYWAWDDTGADYFWVPGTWVEAPAVGYLWTPGYWGWGESGLYLFHAGYWGNQVGFYGGVNYGFGYGGIGFAGGQWRGAYFAYNTAAVSVGPAIHTTYVNTSIVSTSTLVNNTHASFNGGPGGIKAVPTAQQAAFASQPHFQPTAAQVQHQQSARQDKANFAVPSSGVPAHAAMDHPAANVGELQQNARKGIPSPGANAYVPPTAAQRSNPGMSVAPRPSNGQMPGGQAPRQPQYQPRPGGNQSQPRPSPPPQKAPPPPSKPTTPH